MLMVQTNPQPMKSKLKGPPPVPPRPNQTVVAEALAKTRKAVADSKHSACKTRPKSEQTAPKAKAKTLDRTTISKAEVSPKQNGLARVKSFIRDVISDRNASEDRKSSGHSSRRSSSDSNTLPAVTTGRKSADSSSRTIKTCKQIVRSLSTSNRLDLDAKSKVAKSPSFGDKALPLRKAPPPPPSPKPKPKTVKPSIRSSLERKTKRTPEVSPYSNPIDAKPQNADADAPYATVEEANEADDRLRARTDGPDDRSTVDRTNSGASLDLKTSQVTEMLISEILAAKNGDESNSVIDKGKEQASDTAKLKDMNNHEILIYELQAMRCASADIGDEKHAIDSVESEKCGADSAQCESERIAEDEQYACIVDDDLKTRLRKQYRSIGAMSLHGLPPLPKSLRGFAETEARTLDPPNEANHRQPTDLDAQLDYLKKEMADLRQLDLSLLSELWTLGEAMAQWRRQLERSRLRPAPPPPPPHAYLRT